VTVSSQPSESAQSGSAGIKTHIILVNPANSAGSINLVDYPGEDTQFPLVEAPSGHAGSVAADIGGEGATIYSGNDIQKLDRTAGLPRRLMEGGQNLVSLDLDGNIAWYDSRNGNLAAVFSLQPSGWTLRTESGTISGQNGSQE